MENIKDDQEETLSLTNIESVCNTELEDTAIIQQVLD